MYVGIESNVSPVYAWYKLYFYLLHLAPTGAQEGL